MDTSTDPQELGPAAGPGAVVDEGIAPPALLDNATEAEYIDVLNPLPVDFVGQFGVTRPIQASVTIGPESDGRRLNEEEASRRYGVPRLTNPDKSGRAQIANRVRINAGQTMRLMGNEAQVVVRQLVNEIMQREGKRLQLADRYQRRQVEERIVIGRGYIQDIMSQKPQTVSQQLENAIKGNPEITPMADQVQEDKPREAEFPTVSSTPTATVATPSEVTQPTPQQAEHILVEPKPRKPKAKRGRPAKADNVEA